ncbi:MAG: hypothetical protein WBQ16_14280 [Nitrososphaeraceae archaeon]
MSNKVKFCSNCGNELSVDTLVGYCPKCSIAVNATNTVNQGSVYQSPVIAPISYKSPGTSMLIAVVGGLFGLSGIGHIYVGKVGRGITILIAGVVLLAIGLVMGLGFFASQSSSALILELTFGLSYFVLFIWQILDVRDYAKEFNELVKTEGKEPW